MTGQLVERGRVLLVVGLAAPHERAGLECVVEQELLAVVQVVGYEGVAGVVGQVVAGAEVDHAHVPSVCVFRLARSKEILELDFI